MKNGNRLLSLLMVALSSVPPAMAVKRMRLPGQKPSFSNARGFKRTGRAAGSKGIGKSGKNTVDDKSSPKMSFVINDQGEEKVMREEKWSTEKKGTAVGLSSSVGVVATVGAITKTIVEGKRWNKFVDHDAKCVANPGWVSSDLFSYNKNKNVFYLNVPGSYEFSNGVSSRKFKYEYFYLVDKDGNLKLAYRRTGVGSAYTKVDAEAETLKRSVLSKAIKRNGKLKNGKNAVALKKCLVDKLAGSVAWKEGVVFRRGLAKDVIKREIPEVLGGTYIII